MASTDDLAADTQEWTRDDAAILIFATRYALSRRTYAPSLIKDALVRHQDWLSARDADVLIRDVEAQAAFGYGDRCNEDTWADILGWLREMQERGLFRG